VEKDRKGGVHAKIIKIKDKKKTADTVGGGRGEKEKKKTPRPRTFSIGSSAKKKTLRAIYLGGVKESL